MSGAANPAPERLRVAALMAGAVALGVVTGVWHVVRGHLDSVVDRVARW